MKSALIGYSGFVGGNLASTDSYDLLINRANLDSIRNQKLDKIVCAGLPAAKWLANRDPDTDLANTTRLMEVLATVSCKQFTLISTIDVYPLSTGRDEDFNCEQIPNHAYGRHRWQFEQFVRAIFPQAHIIRLPALFGPGLKKNVIFDLLHNNCLETINPESYFQWYPLDRLQQDIQIVQSQQLALVNLFTQPLATAQILKRFFPHKIVGEKAGATAHYDLYTKYGKLFNQETPHYIMSSSAVLDSLANYLEMESVSL